jgi:hypothetical protein
MTFHVLAYGNLGRPAAQRPRGRPSLNRQLVGLRGHRQPKRAVLALLQEEGWGQSAGSWGCYFDIFMMTHF